MKFDLFDFLIDDATTINAIELIIIASISRENCKNNRNSKIKNECHRDFDDDEIVDNFFAKRKISNWLLNISNVARKTCYEMLI